MKIWATKNGHQVFRVSEGHCNIYLVYNGTHFFMVDTGVRRQCDRLLDSMDALGVDEQSLQAVILTHTHFDHAENAALIKQRFSSQFFVHQSEAEYLQKGESPLPGGSLVITRWFMDKVAKCPGIRFPYQPVNPETLVEESYDLSLLGFKASIINTPGHSAGSLSVIVDNEIAIVGDTMYGGLNDSLFPPFADHPKQLIGSWKKLLETGCTLFLPAHGSERKRSLVLKQYDRFKEIYALD